MTEAPARRAARGPRLKARKRQERRISHRYRSDAGRPRHCIYLAGHTGLVGGGILRALQARGHDNLVYRTIEELGLTDQAKSRTFFAQEKPEVVVIAAARVCGIMANWEYPYEFIQVNLGIELNLIHEAYRTGVKRLIFLGSSCIYPRLAPPTQPSPFVALGLGDRLRSVVADLRDHERLTAEMQATQPSVVFHLAAQAIVRAGNADPYGTYETKVMGTVNLLESVLTAQGDQFCTESSPRQVDRMPQTGSLGI